MTDQRLTVLAVAAVAACSSPSAKSSLGGARQQRTPPGDTTNVCAPLSPDSSRARYWTYTSAVIDHGSTRAQLVAYLGVPLSTRVDTMRPTEHRMPIDTVATLRFKAFSVGYILYGHAGEAPSFIEVSDSSAHLPLPIGIGATRSQLEHCFGAPDAEGPLGDSTLVEFPIGQSAFGPNEIVFTFA